MGTRHATANRTQVTTATTGTGTYSLGSAVSGYFHPSDAPSSMNGLRVGYVVVDSLESPTIAEVGEGVLSSGTPWTLTRATIIRSLSGGVAGAGAINWSAGTKYVYLSALAGQMPLLDTDLWLPALRFTATADGSAAAPAIAFADDLDSGIFRAATNALAIATAGVERLRVTATGRVAIGAAAPWASTILFEGYTATTGEFALSGFQAASAAGGAALLLRSDRTDVNLATFYFGASTIVGTITHNTTSTTYGTTSDSRLKDVVGPLTNSGTIIDALDPLRFTWKADASLGEFTGFLAQDVAQHFPEAARASVGAPGDAGFVPAQVDLSKLVPVLWAEVQSLRARIAALET